MTASHVPADEDGLVVLRGPAAGRWIPLPDGTGTLGRVPGTITLDDGEVSRRHVDLRVVDGALELTDLGSANGTFVRGRRLEKPELLYDRDVFRVGKTEIEVRLVPLAPEATVVAPRPADEEGDATAEHRVPLDVPLTPPAYGHDDLPSVGAPSTPGSDAPAVAAPTPSPPADPPAASRPASIPAPPAHTPVVPTDPDEPPRMTSPTGGPTARPADAPAVARVDDPATPRGDGPAAPVPTPRRATPGLPDAVVMPTVGSDGLAPRFAPRAATGAPASRMTGAALFTYAVIVADVIALIAYFATRG
ncbi:MAG: FHA domain-containing protein [Solirubrobacteraceae bacterium]|nr:FHA domain-containing protein [Solirubrobacteraceae bacterium]